MRFARSKPSGAVRSLFWLCASVLFHVALFRLIEGPAPLPADDSLLKPVEVGLLTSSPKSAASPDAAPPRQEPESSPVSLPRPENLEPSTDPQPPAKPSNTAPAAKPKVAPAVPPQKRPLDQRSKAPPALQPTPSKDSERPRRDPSPAVRTPTAAHETSPPEKAEKISFTEAAAIPQVILPPKAGNTPDQGLSARTAPLVEATPRYEFNAPPAYPRIARLSGWEGEVFLRVTVNTAGRPEKVSIHQSSGYPILDETAVRAVRRWRFSPARRGKRPVADEVMIPVHFELRKRP